MFSRLKFPNPLDAVNGCPTKWNLVLVVWAFLLLAWSVSHNSLQRDCTGLDAVALLWRTLPFIVYYLQCYTGRFLSNWQTRPKAFFDHNDRHCVWCVSKGSTEDATNKRNKFYPYVLTWNQMQPHMQKSNGYQLVQEVSTTLPSYANG